MKVYLLDDEKPSLYFLREQVEAAFAVKSIEAEIKTYSLPGNLLKDAKLMPPDIIFTDIEMPGMNGLDLAIALTEIKNDINIIFVTGYDEYAMEALKLYASGYLLKPCIVEDVVTSLEHLRFPVNMDNKHIKIITFGNFCVFTDRQPVKFRTAKSKELLAYLVDRQGSSVTRKEAASVLYEDENYTRYIQKCLCRAAAYLSEDLEQAGIRSLFINGEGTYSLNLTGVECDLFDYLNKKQDVIYSGEYMEQYSWGETRKYDFEQLIPKLH